jgi:hypothetical protein
VVEAPPGWRASQSQWRGSSVTSSGHHAELRAAATRRRLSVAGGDLGGLAAQVEIRDRAGLAVEDQEGLRWMLVVGAADGGGHLGQIARGKAHVAGEGHEARRCLVSHAIYLPG